jgi:hypothetical protein
MALRRCETAATPYPIDCVWRYQWKESCMLSPDTSRQPYTSNVLQTERKIRPTEERSSCKHCRELVSSYVA